MTDPNKKTDQKIASLVSLGQVSNPDTDKDLDSVCQFQSKGQTLNAALYIPYGMSCNIPKGASLVLFANNGSAQSHIGYGSFPENRFRDLKEWELKLGNFKTKAHVFFKENGEVLFNKDLTDAENFMVRFNELQSGFDAAVNKLNSLIAKYNTHVHSGVTTGPGSSGATPSTETTTSANVDGAKIEEFRVP